ncbi:hypothetical protein QQS21_001963 [Conoideocrella luteorostrata]|uniref:Cytochrome P450 n=1 Tax=Conoideocrella luteorostrata TaxID=1105319 RepID=A0AAJ0FXQ5_9HYPO|nr:hypothetical protein QQS21_001963 [Conoideocrella luteorostrata]
MEALSVFWQISRYAAQALLFLLLASGSYNLLLHPLRKYPGPFLAKITDGYNAFAAVRKRNHLVAYQNFQRYGPVVRHAPNRLLFNTVTAVHDIYLNPRVTKGQAYRNSQLRAKFPSVLNALDRDQHRRKRKYIAQPISERFMQKFEPTMQTEIDIFLQKIHTACKTGQIMNLSEHCQRLSFDIVGQLGFGYPFRTQMDNKYRYISRIMEAMSWRISTYMQWPLLRMIETVMLLLNVSEFIDFDNAIKTMIKARTEKKKDAHFDMWSVLADHIGQGEGELLPGEVWPEAILFIIAGGSTTSTAMSSVFFYLSRNRRCYEALVTEIRSTFSEFSAIKASNGLHKCKYLRACIDESLRMAPASLTSLWREQDPKDESGKPLIVDGNVIPRGTQVAISMYSLFHNDHYFPDPFEFKPERWLDTANQTEQEKASQATMRKAFVPFLIGDRACAGKAMGYQEVSLVIAQTLWLFDFEVAPGKAGELGSRSERPDEYDLKDIFIASHQGPNLIFRERNVER